MIDAVLYRLFFWCSCAVDLVVYWVVVSRIIYRLGSNLFNYYLVFIYYELFL
jgi:hypothetical protein